MKMAELLPLEVHTFTLKSHKFIIFIYIYAPYIETPEPFLQRTHLFTKSMYQILFNV